MIDYLYQAFISDWTWAAWACWLCLIAAWVLMMVKLYKGERK